MGRHVIRCEHLHPWLSSISGHFSIEGKVHSGITFTPGTSRTWLVVAKWLLAPENHRYWYSRVASLERWLPSCYCETTSIDGIVWLVR